YPLSTVLLCRLRLGSAGQAGAGRRMEARRVASGWLGGRPYATVPAGGQATLPTRPSTGRRLHLAKGAEAPARASRRTRRRPPVVEVSPAAWRLHGAAPAGGGPLRPPVVGAPPAAWRRHRPGGEAVPAGHSRRGAAPGGVRAAVRQAHRARRARPAA